MAGRFPLCTDADIYGPLVDGLIDRGWDVEALAAEDDPFAYPIRYITPKH